MYFVSKHNSLLGRGTKPTIDHQMIIESCFKARET